VRSSIIHAVEQLEERFIKGVVTCPAEVAVEGPEEEEEVDSWPPASWRMLLSPSNHGR